MIRKVTQPSLPFERNVNSYVFFTYVDEMRSNGIITV